MLQNEWQPNILDKLRQIMFKIIILSQIGADRYQKHIFEIQWNLDLRKLDLRKIVATTDFLYIRCLI